MSDIDYDTLPANVRDGARRWIQYGIPPGGFLRAVIANDLHGALVRADPENLAALPAIARWWWNEPPADCCGSPIAAEEWANLHLAARGDNDLKDEEDREIQWSARAWLAQRGVIVEEMSDAPTR